MTTIRSAVPGDVDAGMPGTVSALRVAVTDAETADATNVGTGPGS
jgi:hypothetical protein